jgi:hypothetical protein
MNIVLGWASPNLLRSKSPDVRTPQIIKGCFLAESPDYRRTSISGTKKETDNLPA